MSLPGTKLTILDVRSLVRYWAMSGQQILKASSSAFGPNRSPAQSIFSPSALTTGVQSAKSAARDCRNVSGVQLSVGSIPESINIRLKDGSAITLRDACAICSTISSGSQPVRAAQWNPSRSCRGSPIRPPSEVQAQR